MIGHTPQEIERLWEHAATRADSTKDNLKEAWMNGILLLLPLALYGFSKTIVFLAGFSFAIFLVFTGVTRWVVGKAEKSRKGSERLWTPVAILLLIGHRGTTMIYIFLIFIITALNPQFDQRAFSQSENTFPLIMGLSFGLALVYSHRQFRLLYEFDPYEMFDRKMHTQNRFQKPLAALILVIPALIIYGYFQGTLGIQDIGLNFLFLFSLLFFFLGVPQVYFALRMALIGLDTSPYRGALNSRLKEVSKELRERHKHAGPTDLPMFCESCNNQMVIQVEDPDLPYYTICSICGAEDASYWCEDSGMGGQFIENLAEHPTSFRCLGCKKVHEVPKDFYENSVTMTLWEEK